MKKTTKRLVILILLVLSCVMIFMFSAQSGKKSSDISEYLTEFFLRLFHITEMDMGRAEHYLRKTAHFVEFFILGALTYTFLSMFMRKKFLAYLLSLFVTILYAVFDELHQYFIPGRSASLNDVLLDSLGALCGIFTVFILQWIVFYHRKSQSVLREGKNT